jgi:hypothetical protein
MEKTIVIIPFALESDSLMCQEMKRKSEFLLRHKNEGYHIIFVNDKGWKDTSKDANFYSVFGHDNNQVCTLIHNNEPSSFKGGAVYSGFRYAIENFPEARFVGYTDLDHSMNLDDAFSKIETSADIHIGIRADRASIDKVKHTLFSLFVKMLFLEIMKVNDLFACFKFFKPAFINDYFNRQVITDITQMFEIDLLIFAIKNGYTINQYKVGWEEIPGTGRSFKNIVRMFTAVLGKRFLNRKNAPVYQF